ncbi:MAG: UbiA family prenyltransferase [archaeon]
MPIVGLLLYVIQLLSELIIGMLQAVVIIIATIISQLFEMKRIKTYLELSRAGNSILTALFVIVVCLMSGLNRYDLMFSAAAAATLVTAAGNSINDYFDRGIDKINKPKRPIPSRRVSAKYAYHYSLLLFAAGIVIAVFINVPTAFIAIVNAFVLYAYAARWKRSGYFGNIVVSYLAASVFIFAAGVASTLFSWLIGFTIAVFAFLVTMGREISKDMEDFVGDSSVNAKTLPVIRGMPFSGKVASSYLGVAICFSWVPYLLGVFTSFYLIIICLADIILLSAIYLLVEKPSEESGANVQKALKAAMFVALIAFIVGSPNIYELVASLL